MIDFDLWAIAQAAPQSPPSATIALIVSALGALCGIGAFVVKWRDSNSGATKGYVDQNLAAQQSRIDNLESEAEQLRAEKLELREERRQDRLRIAELEAELDAVRKECAECMTEVRALKNNPQSS